MTRTPILLSLVLVIALSGCSEARRQNAALAANIYAAADAASQGADLTRTQAAIRLQAERIANNNGFTIEGAQQWIESHQSPQQLAPASGTAIPSPPSEQP